MHTLFATRPPALVVTRNLAVFSEIMEFASQYGVPVLRTAESTSGFMSALISMLNIELAPVSYTHLDVYKRQGYIPNAPC